jgi:hypothetical protein
MPIPSPIRQIVESSGNTFHARVARWLQGEGWHIRVSPYYMDQSQQKAREIDLIAEKLWPIKDTFGRWQGDIVVRLFVECKFVPSHAVFWFTEKDMAAAEDLVCGQGGYRRDNMNTREHHYLSTCARVAKVFASESTRGQDFEPFYKALNQVLNAQVSMGGQAPSSPTLRKRGGGSQVLINYPVVVCSSFEKLYATDFYDEIEPVQIPGNFQLEVQYAYIDRGGTQRDDHFLVDFVDFSGLSDFAKLIAKDAEVAAYLASH